MTRIPVPTGTVDLLILGAGWTSKYLIPLLEQASSSSTSSDRTKISYAATTTTGRDGTIKFRFDPTASRAELRGSFTRLPKARYALVTFPLRGTGECERFIGAYEDTHGVGATRWIQLGSTGIWQDVPPRTSNTISNTTADTTRAESGTEPAPPPPPETQSDQKQTPWITRHSPYNTSSPRAEAEAYLLTRHDGCVLNLSGLWDGETRDPRNWIPRVGGTRDQVRDKKSLHLVHGVDVARAILAVIYKWDSSSSSSDDEKRRISHQGDDREAASTTTCAGQRWMVTDMFVYDWWSLFMRWAEFGTREGGADGDEACKAATAVENENRGGAATRDNDGHQQQQQQQHEQAPSQQATWVREFMSESDVRALPRSMETLGRCYDSREFWDTFGLTPLKAGV